MGHKETPDQAIVEARTCSVISWIIPGSAVAGYDVNDERVEQDGASDGKARMG